MSNSAMITLKDGEKVPNIILAATTYNLKMAAKESADAIIGLVERCKDAQYKFIFSPHGDSKDILRRWALVQPSGAVPAYIQSIVLNSVETSGKELRLVSPISGSITNQFFI